MCVWLLGRFEVSIGSRVIREDEWRLSESDAARHRHAGWCLAFVERADAGLQGPDQASWVERLERERANAQAALGWALEAEPEMALLLASGVAFAAITCGGGYCQGNNNDNKIYGTSGPDEIYGSGGGDTIYGKDGRDSIRGDWHQWLDPGEPGSDTIYGGYGSDYLYGDERTDTLKGGPGNDHINAETDGELDYVDCGKGSEDVAFFDRGIDEVSNCEIRNPPVG